MDGVGINKWGLERIPYSRRIHFIHLSRYLERKIGEISFNDVKKTYEGKILPETHPKSVRVKSIAGDIIEALRKGLRYEQVEGDILECNNVVQKSRRKGSTYHLQGFNWEILVVDYPVVNAFCMPGGKI
ncbi:hypothetical protein C5167_048609, partial [Papaver somniferum]